MSDLRPTIMGLGISMPLLAVIAVFLRYEARRVKKVELGADDYTIFIALVCFCEDSVICSCVAKR